MPKSERNPKSEARRAHRAQVHSRSRLARITKAMPDAALDFDVQISDFGFPSAFGFRPSDFFRHSSFILSTYKFWFHLRMNLLVTGGAGFIGSNLIHHVIDRPEVAKLVNLDCLTYAGRLENLAGVAKHPKYMFEKVDLRDKTATLDV